MTSKANQPELIPTVEVNLTAAHIAAIWGLCLIVKNKHPELYAQDPLNAQIEKIMAEQFFTSNKEIF